MQLGHATTVCVATLGLLLFGCSAPSLDSPSSAPPIFNAHMHAAFVGMDDAAYRREVVAEMDANGISRSVLHLNEYSDLDDWSSPRFMAGPAFPCWANEKGERTGCNWATDESSDDASDGNWPKLAWIEKHAASGRIQVLGELLLVYAGVPPDDPRLDPYWALAQRYDLPVAVHINRGPPPDSPPARPTGCCPNFNGDLGNPALLRPVLARYPKLRIWLQHAGFPAVPEVDNIDYLDETYALLADFPNVYVDMTALNAVAPTFVHEAAVRALVERGFANRLMMGTDNWPAADIIARYRAMTFLTDAQRRGILHDNAAAFFGVSVRQQP